MFVSNKDFIKFTRLPERLFLIFFHNMKPIIPSALHLLCLLILLGCKTSNKISSIDFSDGTYTGEVDSEGRKHGKGTYQWLDGSSYEGDYHSDARHGKGHFRWPNDEYYKGEYIKDQRTGDGIYNWPDGSVYKGSFLNGKRHGQGIFESANGNIYRGEWFDDLIHGIGEIIKKDGLIIKGKWENGKLLTKTISLPQPSEKPEIIIPPLDEKFDEIDPENKEIETSNILSTSQVTQFENLNSNSDSTEGNYTFPDIKLPDPVSGKEKVVSQTNKNESNKEIPTKQLATKKAEDPKTKINLKLEGKNLWTGTPEEAEGTFNTKLIDGIDTVFDRQTNQTFSGKMIILNASGNKNGELELKNGRMHGEELYFENGNLTEKNLWENGKFIKNLPVD